MFIIANLLSNNVSFELILKLNANTTFAIYAYR